MKNLLSIICCGLFLVLSCGCSLIETTPQRTLITKEVFVKQTFDGNNLGFRKINRMKPLLYKDQVIQGNSLDGISSINANTGNVLWKVKIPNGIEASGALFENKIFVGANDGFFYCLQAEDGKILWKFPIQVEGLSEPLVSEGVVYFLTGANTLYAVDIESGKQKWIYSRQDTSPMSIRGGSKPAIRNGTIYTGFSDGAIVALLAQNGAVKWEKSLSKNKKFKDIDTNPLIEGDYLYLSSYDDQIFCLKAGTGETVWSASGGGYGSLSLIQDKLLVPDSKGQLLALNKESGKKEWSFKLKEGLPTGAVAMKGFLIFGESAGSLQILDQNTGKWLSSFTPGRGILAVPTVDEKNNRVYFISNEGNLYGVQVQWTSKALIPYMN